MPICKACVQVKERNPDLARAIEAAKIQAVETSSWKSVVRTSEGYEIQDFEKASAEDTVHVVTKFN